MTSYADPEEVIKTIDVIGFEEETMTSSIGHNVKSIGIMLGSAAAAIILLICAILLLWELSRRRSKHVTTTNSRLEMQANVTSLPSSTFHNPIQMSE